MAWEFPPSTRPYQFELVHEVERFWQQHQRVLFCLPTGLGKTFSFSCLCARAPGRVLVLTHQQELADQTVAEISNITGQSVGLEMGESFVKEHDLLDPPPKIVVGSVQTLSRRNKHGQSRLDKFDLTKFTHVIVDEAHHAIAKSYRWILDTCVERNPNIRIAGCTATPNRTDRLTLKQVFPEVAYMMTISQAIASGYLVQPVRNPVTLLEADFSQIRLVGKGADKDFDPEELDAILTAEKALHEMITPVIQHNGDRSCMVFCHSVKHASLVSEIINRHKPGKARMIAGEQSYAQLDRPAVDKLGRKEIITAFRQGRFQYLCVCNIGYEGFNAPECCSMAMMRITKSNLIVTQALGRVLRPSGEIAHQLGTMPDNRQRIEAISNSSKPRAYVYVFLDKRGTKTVSDCAEVLADKWGYPEQEQARRNRRDDLHGEMEGYTIEEELAIAKAELEVFRHAEAMEKREREEAQERRRAQMEKWRAELARKKHIKGHVQATIDEDSVFGGGRAEWQGGDNSGFQYAGTATAKQLGLLVKLGVPVEEAARFSTKQASAVIGKLLEDKKNRRKNKL